MPYPEIKTNRILHNRDTASEFILLPSGLKAEVKQFDDLVQQKRLSWDIKSGSHRVFARAKYKDRQYILYRGYDVCDLVILKAWQPDNLAMETLTPSSNKKRTESLSKNIHHGIGKPKRYTGSLIAAFFVKELLGD